MKNLSFSALRRPILIALAAAACLVSACTVGPNYVRPVVEVPVDYKEAGGWKPAQPQDSLKRGQWWQMFNDPVLNELEQQVDAANQNIYVAEAQFRQARAVAQSSRAAYFPTVTTSPSVTRSRQSANLTSRSTSRSSSSGVTLTDLTLPIDASWEADVWGRIRRSVESSQASAQASAADLESIRLSTEASLAADYFQLRGTDAQRKLLDETIVEYQKALQLTRNRYMSGVASKADVATAETQLETTQAQAIDLGVQRAQIEHAIAILIGKPPAGFSLPVLPSLPAPAPVPRSVPSELLERRPDIGGAERRVAAANAQIGVAQAAFFPTLTLTAAAGFESSDISNWFSWPSRFWSLGPATLAQTLFDAGRRKALSDQAVANYDATVGTYREIVLSAFQEVEDNLAALRILAEESQVQDDAVKAARESVKLTLNQYFGGVATYLNVVIVQTSALANERTAVEIAQRRMVASVQLVKALGGGWRQSDLPSNDDLVSSRGPSDRH